MHIHSCLLDELLQTYVHKQVKGSKPQTRVITLDAHLRERLLWAAAVLEQAIPMGHFAWDAIIAAVQARCLSCEADLDSVDGGTIPHTGHDTILPAKQFPVQFVDSAVSHGAIIQDKWFTRYVWKIP